MFPRTLYLNKLIDRRNNGLIKIITGARRVGKSYLMNNIFYNCLINQGFIKNNIILFSFDDDNDIDKLEKYYPDEPTKIFNKNNQYTINSKKFRAYINDKIVENQEYILLLDEIQILDNFVGTLNGFLKKENCDIYVTGSNSELLSSDIDTKFNGRGSVIHVLPLSFKEYMEGLNLSVSEAYASYWAYGGIPLVALMKNADEKITYLTQLANEIYFQDIVKHNGIRNIDVLDDLYSILASNIGSTMSPTRIVNTFKSVKNKKVCDDTIKVFIEHLEHAFVVSQARTYDIKGLDFINSPYKIYFEDIGVRNARLNAIGNDEGHVLENIIYNDLRYKGYAVSVGRINYYKKDEKKNTSIRVEKEIDFVATYGYKKYYIQVCLNILDDNTYNHEIEAFSKINDSFKKILIVKDGLIKRITQQGFTIIDVFDFLLSDNLEF